jgi:epoxide hydrolase-like predicted phosphatase
MMMDMTFTTVVFDMGNVLVCSDEAAMLADIKQDLGITDEEVAEVMEWEVPLLTSGVVTEAQFWRRVRHRIGIRKVKVQENLLGRVFAQNLRRFEQMYAMVEELKQAGIVVAVQSDTIEPHAAAHRAFGSYEPFEHVFLSHEVGLRKPDPAFFRFVLTQLEADPADTLFVDDLQVNVDAAHNLGMSGILFAGEDATARRVRSYCLDGQAVA